MSGPGAGQPRAAVRRPGALPMGMVAYESIRDAIVDGRHEPGSQLVQEQLAEDLGISRTPVRDALNRLTQEGLVTWRPGLGYVVNDLSDEEVIHVHQVRERLESLALELACGRLDRVQEARLRLLIEEMVAADPADAKAQYDLNRRFHQGIIEPCGNPILLTILDQLWDNPLSRRITRSYIHDEKNVHRMIDEHRAILQASLDGDRERLLTLALEHMREGYGDSLTTH
ncbi:MAG TPA: GntR family transcriptional regulator [Intrasporangium sp.]|nr:GntR family transcriptional regulator [Intrasporangium sp.]